MSKEEGKEEKREEQKEKPIKLKTTNYEALSALLDFYSDRAVAHASFLVACVFGLFTLLALMKEANVILKVVYSIAYWILWCGGYYSLMGFNRYATDADNIRRFIQSKSALMKKNDRGDKKHKGIHLRLPYDWINEKSRVYKLRLIVISYLVIGILPWLFTVEIPQWLFTLLCPCL